MCKYCDGKADLPVTPCADKTEQTAARIMFGNQLIIMSFNKGIGSIEINYCPICGNKLKEQAYACKR